MIQRGLKSPLFLLLDLSIETKISEYILELIPDESIFLVDLRISRGAQKKLAVTLDGDNGVPIEVCAEVSRKLGNIIEEEDLIDSKYILEVSSPGLDQPLKMKRQYVKNIGRDVKIWLTDGNIQKGKLLAVKDNDIVVEVVKTEKIDGKKKTTQNEETILFENINKTNIQVSFK